VARDVHETFWAETEMRPKMHSSETEMQGNLSRDEKRRFGSQMGRKLRRCSSRDLFQDIRWKSLSTTNMDQCHKWCFRQQCYFPLHWNWNNGLHIQSCRCMLLGLSQFANNKPVSCKNSQNMKWISRLLIKPSYPVKQKSVENPSQLQCINWLSSSFHFRLWWVYLLQ